MRLDYRQNQILIYPVENGFVVRASEREEEREDRVEKEYCFNDIDDLTYWLLERFEGQAQPGERTS